MIYWIAENRDTLFVIAVLLVLGTFPVAFFGAEYAWSKRMQRLVFGFAGLVAVIGISFLAWVDRGIGTEEVQWHLAKKENTIHSYVEFEGVFPGSQYREQAVVFVRTIEEGELESIPSGHTTKRIVLDLLHSQNSLPRKISIKFIADRGVLGEALTDEQIEVMEHKNMGDGNTHYRRSLDQLEELLFQKIEESVQEFSPQIVDGVEDGQEWPAWVFDYRVGWSRQKYSYGSFSFWGIWVELSWQFFKKPSMEPVLSGTTGKIGPPVPAPQSGGKTVQEIIGNWVVGAVIDSFLEKSAIIGPERNEGI